MNNIVKTIFQGFLVILLLIGGGQQTAGGGQEKKLLILHSYAPDFAWTRQLQQGIMSVLADEKIPLRYRVEYMDTKNFINDEYLDQLFGIYKAKYANMHFDAIIVTDNNALNFISRYKEELFPGVKIVAAGINSISVLPHDLENIHIIIEKAAYGRTLEQALRMTKGVENIYIIVDDTTTGRALKSEMVFELEPYRKRYNIRFLPPDSIEDLEEFLSHRTGKDLVYVLTYFRDATDRVFTDQEATLRLAGVSTVPVYVSWDFQMETGAVGGCLVSATGHGEKAARVLLDLWQGKAVSGIIKNTDELNRFIFDYNVLVRFGIAEDHLPPETILLHKPLTFYEKNRQVLQASALVMAVLVVIIWLLAINLKKQRIINIKNTAIIKLDQELIETQQELVLTLGEVIEVRSRETANHVKRVAKISRLLAKQIGLPPDAVEMLESISPMHDVGKIGIEETILHKPGKLDNREFNRMKEHTLIGHDILQCSDREFFIAAAIIAHQHHERWDGKGYPQGLKGEEIHIFARITKIVDVYDALMNERVYKKPWPHEKALHYIRQEKGRMFDPELVDIFFEHLDAIQLIQKNYSNKQKVPVSAQESPEPDTA